MGDAGGFFRGTSTEQDARFSDKYKKYCAGRKFPPEFDLKVDPKKVAMDAIKPWVAKRITEILGFEDEVLIGYAFGLLEDKETLNPRELQLNMDVFLEAETPHFVTDLWKLLLSAQASPGGIPAEFLEQKKAELRQKREEDLKVKNDLSAAINRDRERVVQEMEHRRAVSNHSTDSAPTSTSTGGRNLPYGLYTPKSSSDKHSAEKDDRSDRNGDHRRRDREEDRGHGRKRERSRSRDRNRRRDEERSRDRERRDRHRDRDRRHRERSREKKHHRDEERSNDGRKNRQERSERSERIAGSDEGKRKREVDNDRHDESNAKRTCANDSERLKLESSLREQAMSSLLHARNDSTGE